MAPAVHCPQSPHGAEPVREEFRGALAPVGAEPREDHVEPQGPLGRLDRDGRAVAFAGFAREEEGGQEGVVEEAGEEEEEGEPAAAEEEEGRCEVHVVVVVVRGGVYTIGELREKIKKERGRRIDICYLKKGPL